MINNLIDKFENLIWGRKIYNLEKELQVKDEKKLKDIQDYIGSFIVTERGYLIPGHDSILEKKYAQILGSDPLLPPFIVYENKTVDKIINDLLGLRLAEFKFQPKIKTRISFAY